MLGRAGKTGFAQESDRHPVLRGSVVSGSAIGYITPNGMLAGRQQETTPNGIGSGRQRGNNGGFVAASRMMRNQE